MTDIERLDEMMKLLKRNTIRIPMSVVKRTDVDDSSKELFGIIFTEALEEADGVTEKTTAINTVKEIMQRKIRNITDYDIEEYCLCGDVPKCAKEELKKLLESTDISMCFC